MKCPHCNNEIGESVAYCSFCGKPINAGAETAETKSSKRKTKSKKNG